MTELLAVALGGAVGSVGRWGIGSLLRAWAPGLPAGTLVANVLAGLVTVGLCGGLSTFSTFSSETLQIAQSGDVAGAAANVALNVGACLVAVWAGTRLGAALAGA